MVGQDIQEIHIVACKVSMNEVGILVHKGNSSILFHRPCFLIVIVIVIGLRSGKFENKTQSQQNLYL
jgi:hypothetical protein